MPRVTDAYRDARREEIALAALRRLRLTGIRGTTMADIIEESGLSAGAIYSHFRNKAELAGFVASVLVSGRLRAIVDASSAGSGAPSPAAILERLLPSLEQNDVPFEVVVELWGEAGRDPEMRDVVQNTIATMRATFDAAVLPWLTERNGRTPTGAEREAVTLAMSTICQGWIARRSLYGPEDPGELLAGIRAAFPG